MYALSGAFSVPHRPRPSHPRYPCHESRRLTPTCEARLTLTDYSVVQLDERLRGRTPKT